ncbi:MAG: hypothetical protein AAF771_05550 [Pseudomonadota bacterium]
MTADLTQKARENRKAALEYVAVRRSKLVSLSEFRTRERTVSRPLMGFVSTRASDFAA